MSLLRSDDYWSTHLRLIQLIFIKLVALSVVAGVGTYFLLYSAVPVKFLAEGAEKAYGIKIDRVLGSLGSGLRIENLMYQDKNFNFRIGNIYIDYKLGNQSITSGKFVIEKVFISNLDASISKSFHDVSPDDWQQSRDKLARQLKDNILIGRLIDHQRLEIKSLEVNGSKIILAGTPETAKYPKYHLQGRKKIEVRSYKLTNLVSERTARAATLTLGDFVMKSNFSDIKFYEASYYQSNFSWKDNAKVVVKQDMVGSLLQPIHAELKGSITFKKGVILPDLQLRIFDGQVEINVNKYLQSEVKVRNFTPSQYFDFEFPMTNISFDSNIRNPLMISMGLVPVRHGRFQLGKTVFLQSAAVSASMTTASTAAAGSDELEKFTLAGTSSDLIDTEAMQKALEENLRKITGGNTRPVVHHFVAEIDGKQVELELKEAWSQFVQKQMESVLPRERDYRELSAATEAPLRLFQFPGARSQELARLMAQSLFQKPENKLIESEIDELKRHSKYFEVSDGLDSRVHNAIINNKKYH